MNALRVTILIGALVILSPGVTAAEPPAKSAPTSETDARKVLRPGEVEIRGRVRKQTAPSITPPSVVIRPQPEQQESFLKKIVEAVDKEPF